MDRDASFIHNDRDIDPVLEMPAVVLQAQSQLRTAMRCERCRVEHRSAEAFADDEPARSKLNI
jgi:hypothetical protein